MRVKPEFLLLFLFGTMIKEQGIRTGMSLIFDPCSLINQVSCSDNNFISI